MEKPKYKKCKCGEVAESNFYESKFNMYKVCCREMNKKSNAKKKAKKPFKCKCGVTDPSKFRDGRKGQCNKCYNKAQRKLQAKVILPPTMSPEEQKIYSENATSVMKDNLRIRRELRYG